MKRVDKILGADVELGNVFRCAAQGVVLNEYAACLLLAEIDGVPANSAFPADAYRPYYAGSVCIGVGGGAGTASGVDPQDLGRVFLVTSGGAAYIDLGHLEVCTPEVRSARDFVAAHHAGLRLAGGARGRANEKLLPGERIVVMANNSDRLGQSWGGHLNVLVSRDLWTRTFDPAYQILQVLAAFQVSSIIYTGQGKVGSENGRDPVNFQITQRGDFFECLSGVQTTHHRPLCNMRDEAHAGTGTAAADLARMHIIFHDTTLTHVSNFLKAGVTQITLAMLESGWCDRELILADPLAALTKWGHDPDLRAVAPLADGRSVTAVEHQQMFAAAARSFVATGEAEYVPDAEHILDVWEDTLAKLACRDFTSLAGRLDWVMKRALLERLVERNPGLGWDSPAMRAADLLFASLDPAEGLYWAVEVAGGAERIVNEGDIRRAMRKPPSDTRAWGRTSLLRQVGRHCVASVNWDEIRLKLGAHDSMVTSFRFDDPRRFTLAEMQDLPEHESIRADGPDDEPVSNETE